MLKTLYIVLSTFSQLDAVQWAHSFSVNAIVVIKMDVKTKEHVSGEKGNVGTREGNK